MEAVRSEGSELIKFVLIVLAMAVNSLAIVDIAPQEVGEKPGVSGNIAGAYADKSGNTQKKEYEASGRLQYDSNTSYLFFVQAAYERSTSLGVEIEREIYSHARYLYKLNEATLYAELFTQARHNRFKDIDLRLLAGGNLRWRIVNNACFGKLYLGAGAFQERIDYIPLSPEQDLDTLRGNSYIAYTQQFSDQARYSMIGYYQPSLEETSDEYASLLAELQINIYKKLYVNFIYEIDYDSKPPQGVAKQDKTLKTSISWKF